MNALYKLNKISIRKFNPIMIVIRNSEINKYSKPCTYCSKMIIKYGITKVYYADNS